MGGDAGNGGRPLCFAFYETGLKVGESRAKVQVVEKQIEVIKYVEKKKALIQSRPNAGRDDLLVAHARRQIRNVCYVYPPAGQEVALELEKVSDEQAPRFWEWLEGWINCGVSWNFCRS